MILTESMSFQFYFKVFTAIPTAHDPPIGGLKRVGTSVAAWLNVAAYGTVNLIMYWFSGIT